MEAWKTIKGFDNYKVSTLGRVMNIRTGHVLIPFTSKNGYKVVSPSRGGKSHKHYVHRLVAEAFIPIDNLGLQVNHINGDKSDNRLENLEWCTSSENHLHRARVLGIKSDTVHMDKLRELARQKHCKPIRCVESGVIYNGGVEAAKAIGRSPTSVWQALIGRTETCGGLHWEYT